MPSRRRWAPRGGQHAAPHRAHDAHDDPRAYRGHCGRKGPLPRYEANAHPGHRGEHDAARRGGRTTRRSVRRPTPRASPARRRRPGRATRRTRRRRRARAAAVACVVTSPTLLTRAVLPAVRERGGGRVIQIGSDAPERPRPEVSPCLAAKAAQHSLTECRTRALGPYGVTVNTCRPGLCPGRAWVGWRTGPYSPRREVSTGPFRSRSA
ncbi:SDR family oxidoreductase [Streptomyces buecherae]|uniref:SDR family oxidoreductase n=1 Tax=Streptomyces buecherae TaxID=2763006 RepID=UPI003658A849